MKKTILILSLIAVLITACSKSETKNSNELSTVLLKKAISIYTDQNQVTHQTNYDYQYDGNKIVKYTSTSTTDGNSTYTFTYTGDLITKAQIVNVGINPNTSTYNLLYDNNNRISAINEVDGNQSFSLSFVYNADATVTANRTTDSYTKYYFTSSGDVLKTEDYTQGVLSSSNSYTYDNSNSPFKNVIGNSWFINGIFDMGSKSNLSLNHNVTSSINSNSTTNINFAYTYSSGNYPMTCTYTNNSEQYFYE